MKTIKLLFLPIALLAICFTTGCASVMSGTNQNISVISKPDGAKATFYNAKGEAISAQTTPCIVSLKRQGNYKLKIEKDEYAPLDVDLKRGINGWYFGNMIFGGLIGFIIIDPATGAMWNLTPDNVKTELALSSSGQPSVLIKPPAPKSMNYGRN